MAGGLYSVVLALTFSRRNFSCPLSFAEKKVDRKKPPRRLALRQIFRFLAKITKNDVAP